MAVPRVLFEATTYLHLGFELMKARVFAARNPVVKPKAWLG